MEPDEEWWKPLLYASDALFWEQDAQTARLLYLGKRASALFRYPSVWWARHPGFWWEIIHPADRERVLAERQRFTGTEADYTCQFRVVAANARVYQVNQFTCILWDAQDRPDRLSIWILDDERAPALH